MIAIDPKGEDRGVSEVIAVALLIGIVVLSLAVMVAVMGPELAGDQEEAELAQAEQALTQLDADALRVAMGSSGSQQLDLGLRGNDGTLDVKPESGHITVEYLESFDDGRPTTVTDTSLGKIEYTQGDSRVAYQGGGVWRQDGDGSVMVSAPEISQNEQTLSMPIIRTEGQDSVHSDVQITPTASTVEHYPNASNEQLSNTVDSGIFWITIDSRYYDAWGSYFESETDGEVVVNHDQERVTIVFFASDMDFSPDAGIIATSGPGEIRVEGSGSYIDSYNSSIGPYEDTQSEEGTVKAAGDVKMFGGSQIYGEVDSNRETNLSGGSVITDDVSSRLGWYTDGDSEIQGETDYDANVPVLAPLDTIIENKAQEVKQTNDNDQTALIEDEQLVLGGEDGELPAGTYYLETLELEDGETLTLDASTENVTIVVEDYVVLDEGTIEVAGEEDGGTVQVYVASEESSGITVPGSGGYVADHFYVDGDSQIQVHHDDSTRFQILGPAHFTGAIRASGADQPQVTATILAPSRDGPGELLVRDAELFGSVVTGNFTAENNAEVHFDRAILGEELPFGDGMTHLEYVWITEHAIAIDGD